MTLLILVFSEITPKTLGAVYASTLSPFVGHALQFLVRALAPALVVSRVLTNLLSRGEEAIVSRGEVAVVISAAARAGTLSREEALLFANLLRFHEVRVQDVMTPRTVTYMLPADATVADLLADRESEAFSRIPLYRDERDEVLGYVLQREVLQAAATGCERGRRLDTFLRPIQFVPALVSVGDALRRFLDRREPIAIATDEHGGVAGLLTLEDLTETILGAEIVDEYDRIVDLRRAALEQRDRRLERIRRKREQTLGAAGGAPNPAGDGT
jgi:CBS domain containing-hemolysin-like protein